MADTPAPTPQSDSLDEIATEDLISQVAELRAEFTEKYDAEAPLAELNEIAAKIERYDAEIEQRELAAAADAAEREELAKRIAPAVSEDETEAEAVEVEADQESEAIPAEAETEAVEAEERELVTASAKRPSASAVARRTATPSAPATDDQPLVITASADVPGYANGQRLDRQGIATAFHARARGLGDSKGKGSRFSVATIETPIPAEFRVKDGTVESVDEVITAAVDSQLKGRDAEALVASGGWCAPSETMYDLFSVESRDALFDLPMIGVSRGGIQFPAYLGISAAAGALWTWTEGDDSGGTQAITDLDVNTGVATATVTDHGYSTGQTVTISGTGVALLDGTYSITVTGDDTFTFTTTAGDTTDEVGFATLIKGCLTIPCPTFTEARLEAEGLCITHGNLSDRAYPELTTRFVDLVMTAHMHRMSNAMLAKVIATAEAVTVTSVPTDAAGDILNAIDLQVADYRSEHLMGANVVLDMAAPQWFIEAIRSSLAMRAGVAAWNISNAEVVSYFTTRNVRPQFLAGYEPLFDTTPATGWPATSKFLLMPAGGYVAADGGSIDLGVVRDSTLNQTNDFTAAWSEQFYTVIQRGPDAREVTVTTDVTGQTGGPQFIGS